MKLLKITNREIPELEQHFEENVSEKLEQIAPEVRGEKPDVKLDDISINEFDIVYAEIPPENAVFGRVLLEIIEEKGVTVNYSSTAFFIMSKKNYLYHVLHEKSIPAPKTAVVADEKAARNLENHLKGPLVAKKFDGLVEAERTKIEKVEGIQEFAEGVDYGENILVFNELRKGEKYRCLVAGNTVISLKDTSDNWKVKKENLGYSNLPNDLEKTVLQTAEAIGTKTAEIVLRNGKVIDANPNPDLEMYTETSGKDAYKAVAKALKEE